MKNKSKNKVSKPAEDTKDVEKYKMQLVRALADYDNLRKRTQKQLEESGIVAKTQFVTRLIPALDMLGNAAKHVDDPGLIITLTAFEETLKDEGFSKMNVKIGDTFDEHKHEAVEVVSEEGKKDSEITSVLVDGWIRDDGYVIRHARVNVNKN